MSKDDEIRLRHMLDAAREASSYGAGRQRSDLDQDRMLVHALVRCLEIVGEAAAQVSPECRSAISTIPWPDIVGMRNRLVHAYFDIDLNVVWDTVAHDLPPLMAELERYLAGQQEG